MQATDGNTLKLLKAWRRDPEMPGIMERIIRDGYKGLQVSSVDNQSKAHLEGIALYAVKHYGVYLRALETAPWNRINRRIRGIARVLVAGLALESGRRGHNGSVFTIPTNSTAEKFNRACGFLSFQQYAKKTGMKRHNYPPGYACCMVLDGEGARELVDRQLSCQGSLRVHVDIPSAFFGSSGM